MLGFLASSCNSCVGIVGNSDFGFTFLIDENIGISDPQPMVVGQGNSREFTIDVTRSGDQTVAIGFVFKNLPDGITGSFGPLQGTGKDQTIHATLEVGPFVPTGIKTLLIEGSANGLTDDLPVSLKVEGRFYYNINPVSPVSVLQGGSGTTQVTIIENSALEISLRLDNNSFSLPGIDVTFAPYQSDDPTVGLTTGNPVTLTLAVAEDVPPGVYNLTINGSSNYALGKSVSLPLTVTAFSLALNPAPVNLARANTASSTVTITRTGYAGVIALSAENLSQGVSASFNPASTTGNSSVLTLTALAGATLESRTARIRGTPPTLASLTSRTGDLGVTVTPPLAGPPNTTWTFCPVSGLPVWVAVQDGSTSVPWTQVTGSNNAYPFLIASAKGGIAYVTLGGGVYQLHVFYGSQTELQTQGAGLCSNGGAVKTINGSVSNTGTAASAFASLGNRLAVVAPPGTTTFQMRNVAPGSLDLIAATVDGATPQNPIRMLQRRNLNAADGSTLAALDFAGGEAFVPQSATLTLANTLGQPVNLDGYLHTGNNLKSLYYDDANSSAATSRTLFGVPAANQSAGDLHYWSALATSNVGSGAVPFRTQGVVFGNVAAQTLTFGPALSTPTFSKPTGVVARAVLPVQAEYNKFWEAVYDQVSSAGRLVTVQMTLGYLGVAATANLDLPDLSTVPGWNSTYGLATGTPAAWKVTASSWSTYPVGLTFVEYIAGATYASATAQGGTVVP